MSSTDRKAAWGRCKDPGWGAQQRLRLAFPGWEWGTEEAQSLEVHTASVPASQEPSKEGAEARALLVRV